MSDMFFYILWFNIIIIFGIRIYLLWYLVKVHKDKLKFDPFSTEILIWKIPKLEEATSQEYFLRKSYNMLTNIMYFLLLMHGLFFLVDYVQTGV